MFIDRARLLVESGAGGNGAISFRREKYVPRGGPDGGRGGNGGSVLLRASARKKTLYDLTREPRYQAAAGEAGRGRNQSGSAGSDCVIEVPVGTQVLDQQNGQLVADLVADGQEVIVARGGQGGRGNATFRTSTNRAPRLAEQGEPGITRQIQLELKLIADIGIVGLPNAGKSTFLGSVTRAKPLVAGYPFSTLHPNLGVADHRGNRFILVDIPGIIEGASQGAGLGLEFLRHIERTRFLVYLIDTSPMAEVPPLEAFRILREECGRYSETLPGKPFVVIATKLDLDETETGFRILQKALSESGIQVLGISAVVNRGLDTVLDVITQNLPEDDISEVRIDELPVSRSMINQREFRFQSPFLERLLQEVGSLDEEGINTLNRKLRESGFIQYLKQLRESSVIHINQIRFIWNGRKLTLDKDNQETTY